LREGKKREKRIGEDRREREGEKNGKKVNPLSKTSGYGFE